MIRIILLLIVVSVAGLSLGIALRPADASTASEPTSIVRSGDFSAIQERMQSKIVLYSLSTCETCTRAREFLDEHGVAYAELDVGESLAARLEAKTLGARNVPLMLIGDVGIEGFNQEQWIALLDQQAAR